MLAGADRVRTLKADLASLDQVRDMAEQVKRDELELHALVNNAGIGSGKPDLNSRQESADGHELRMAVNYLSGFLLTLELLPLLRESAPARIVNVASVGQAPIDFDDPMITRGYSGDRAYCQSKLAQIMHAFDLAEAGVIANALHPATYMPTKMVTDSGTTPISSLEEGTRATARLVVDPELEELSGRYFDGRSEAQAHPQAYDADARRRLRELSERLAPVSV
jgi:NAD(P)-dependent dehydrogenase (short-subunit alcohol dehydrogenase family)